MAKYTKKGTNRGRKDLYEVLDIKDKLESIRGWALHGSTDDDMMKMLGVGKDTFYKWKREKSEFADAIKRGKAVANGELLNSAFKQSTGFMHTEKVPIKLKRIEYNTAGKKIKEEEYIEIVEVEKYIEPNPTMNIFMLKNRLPEEYKDKHEHDVNVTNSKLEDYF